MSKAVVARPMDGITINTKLEFLLDDDGEVRMFDSPEQAKSFLTAAGVEPEELRHMTIMESCGICRKCGSPLFKSLSPGYTFQCFTCDEDFYHFEQEAVVADVKNMTPMELASASTYVRSGWKNIYTQELCRRAGLLERYLNADDAEVSTIVRRAAKSFGIKLI